MQVVAAVGRHDADPAREAAGEEQGEQVAGGLVGPVDVLDDEQERGLGGEVVEGRVDRLDEVAAVDHLVARGRRGWARGAATATSRVSPGWAVRTRSSSSGEVPSSRPSTSMKGR